MDFLDYGITTGDQPTIELGKNWMDMTVDFANKGQATFDAWLAKKKGEVDRTVMADKVGMKVRGRLGECMAALAIGLDPRIVLNWNSEKIFDDGIDFKTPRGTVDVKTGAWRPIDELFFEQRHAEKYWDRMADILAFVKMHTVTQEHAIGKVIGYIDSAMFKAQHYVREPIAGKPALCWRGPWYPVRELSAPISTTGDAAHPTGTNSVQQ